jgi:hypothetical protein
MADKTQENNRDVVAFLATVENPTRRADAVIMLEVMGRVTGLLAKMWGAAIIGFGSYHYKYESGREGDGLRVGFSPRKANLAIYIMPGYTDYSEILGRLGKHKKGKSCLNINKLADVDMGVLEELIVAGFADMEAKYPR